VLHAEVAYPAALVTSSAADPAETISGGFDACEPLATGPGSSTIVVELAHRPGINP